MQVILDIVLLILAGFGWLQHLGERRKNKDAIAWLAMFTLLLIYTTIKDIG